MTPSPALPEVGGFGLLGSRLFPILARPIPARSHPCLEGLAFPRKNPGVSPAWFAPAADCPSVRGPVGFVLFRVCVPKGLIPQDLHGIRARGGRQEEFGMHAERRQGHAEGLNRPMKAV
jgi:hypothetical protein